MCPCPAHRELVDCTCSCDHTGDRLKQYRQRIQDLEVQVAAHDDLLIIANRYARRVYLLKVHGQELANEYSRLVDAVDSGKEILATDHVGLLDRWAAIRDKALPAIGDRLPVRRHPNPHLALAADLREQVSNGVREAVIKLRSALVLLGQSELIES